VTKSFSPRELVRRVQAILRRGGPPAGQAVTSCGGGVLVIDEPQRLVTVRGTEVGLTPTEWRSWWRWPRTRAGSIHGSS
jgi:two-component system, OmpR family, phosphate regulon response regulator PhoB